jgi:hypothetical protein
MIRVIRQHAGTPMTLEAALLIMAEGPDDTRYDAAQEYILHDRDPQVQRLLRQAMEEAYGPLPQATGYSDSGEAFWRTGDIAAYLGMPVDELDTFVHELRDDYGAAGIADTRTLHTVH